MRVFMASEPDVPLARDIPTREFDLMVWAQELTLTGLIGITDPPRPEARDAIRLCKQAGTQVKRIAAAIARELEFGTRC